MYSLVQILASGGGVIVASPTMRWPGFSRILRGLRSTFHPFGAPSAGTAHSASRSYGFARLKLDDTGWYGLLVTLATILRFSCAQLSNWFVSVPTRLMRSTITHACGLSSSCGVHSAKRIVSLPAARLSTCLMP